jgi:hypothetical protein
MTKPFTQAELMTEGFWDTFKKPFRVAAGVARGAVAGAAKALDYALPELTGPLKGAEAAARDIGSAVKTGYEKHAKGLKQFIADELEEIGYQLEPNSKLVKNGNNYVVGARRIRGYDQAGNPQLATALTSFLVDKNGKILRTRGGTQAG